MMEFARVWLMSILAAGILCSVADTLMPSGSVKRVGKLVCGLVLVCAMFTPFSVLDFVEGERWLKDYFNGLNDNKSVLEEQVDREMKVIIERECAAYIVDKATQMGFDCTVQVTCRMGEDGLLFPYQVQVTGQLEQEARKRLLHVIQEDLGVPAERQIFVSEGGLS